MSEGQRAERKKLHGRDFYKSIGSPTMILAPMVEQSEFAWRMLSRSFMTPETTKDLLAYTPMFHARMFSDTPKYRESHFQPLRGAIPSPPDAYHASQYSHADQYLDGNTKIDRPLFVQFCANEPDELLAAARHVRPWCDAVDLNLGCPQGIAKRGHYGSFLQEDWDTIYKLINTLHKNLDIPVTAKMRCLETKEKTLEYAQMMLSAGASILTVHGRQRHQKGHNTGLADWSVLRYLRENLPPDTVLFANGNILRHEDIATCLQVTGFDGVMSAEGNLYDPTIFSKPPPPGQEGRGYWRGKDGKGGYRMDAVLRRYMDIIHRYVLGQEPPIRAPLFMPNEEIPAASEPATTTNPTSKRSADDEDAQSKKQKQMKAEKKKAAKQEKRTSPNLVSMQAHLFHMLRSLVSRRTDIRDALARCRSGDIPAFENVLTMVEAATKEGLLEYEAQHADHTLTSEQVAPEPVLDVDPTKTESSLATVAMCKRPWFICQPYVRPLPDEALEKGSLQLSKKEKARLAREEAETKEAGLGPEGRVEEAKVGHEPGAPRVEIAKEGMVCG
ncbi:dihydrouridine synthase-domain-containing protein [Delphinella strobiligena]|nr:dihydrouridine synthase-domain-containing protein [Delphinella strobiligena]